MSKPTDATANDVFKELAARIEELVISLFVADAGNSVRALRFDIRDPLIGRRPAVLSMREETFVSKAKDERYKRHYDITSSK